MNIDYELYRIFYYVVQHGTISKAAEYLYISQPAVSQAIANLEDKLGGKLFIRTKKGIVLTDEGKVLFDYIKTGIDSFTKGENAFLNYKNLDSGSIRIGASTTVTRNVVMPYIETFHKRYPNVDIKITNHLTNELVTLLRSGELDLLVVNLPMKEHKDLTIIPIVEVQDIFVGNIDYYNITSGSLKLTELSSYPLVFQQSPSNTREFLDNYFKTNGLNIKPQNEIVSYNLVMDFVKAGFGIGYATKDFILDDLENEKLFEIKMEPKVPKRHIGIVLINKTIPNYSANKLIDIMIKKQH